MLRKVVAFLTVLKDHAEIESALQGLEAAAWHATDPDLLALCTARMAMILGCADDAAFESPERLAAVPRDDVVRWPTSLEFGERERVCLAFAESFVIDVASMGDSIAGDARRHLGTEGLVNLASALLVMEQRLRLHLAWNAIFGHGS